MVPSAITAVLARRSLTAALFGPGRSVAALGLLGRRVVHPLLVEGQERRRIERVGEHGAVPAHGRESGAHPVEAGDDDLVLDAALFRDVRLGAVSASDLRAAWVFPSG